jgi:hypothetical protein
VTRLLLHRVHERRVEDVDLVDIAGEVLVYQHLHRTDQLGEMRPVAELHGARDNVRAEALHEAQALVADDDIVDVEVLRAPLLVLLQHEAEHVRVHAAAQSLVGGDQDHADPLHRRARRQERMLVLGVRLRDVHRDVERLLEVRACGAHAVLGLLHLRDRDHLHRFGDLARVLHALDLVANLFGACHRRS